MTNLSHQHGDGLAPLAPRRFLSLLSSPPPSPSPSQFPPLHFQNLVDPENYFLFSIPLPKIDFDLATLAFIVVLLFLSLSAFAFIFFLYEQSRRLHHLQNFNSLWIVRLLLVLLVSVWSVNEISRLPYVRRKYFYTFLPLLSLEQEANICKLHIVLSLGFLEPGFLITLLFLINVSIKKKSPRCISVILSVLSLCVPILILQILVVYVSPFQSKLPEFAYITSVISTDGSGKKMVLCTCPFLSWLLISGFTIAYSFAFTFSCWRAIGFAINKGIGNRISVLATTVMVALPLQIISLCLSWLWMPQNNLYGIVVLVVFLCVASCMAVALVLLVHKPIKDALEAGGDFVWNFDGDLLRQRPAAR